MHIRTGMIILLIFFLRSTASFAADIIVYDENTLRSAMANPGTGDRILFDRSGRAHLSITLSGPLSDASSDFILDGGIVNGRTGVITRNTASGAPEFYLINIGVSNIDAVQNIEMSNGISSEDDAGGAFTAGDILQAVTNSSFRNNISSSTPGGGALYLGSSLSGNITDNTRFEDNKALRGSGGAVYVDWVILGSIGGSGAAVRFDRNTAAQNGGAVFARGNFGVSDIFSNISESYFASNKALGGSGGGIYIGRSFNGAFGNNAVFDKNTASVSGGAVYVSESFNGDIRRSRFTENEAGVSGGGLYVGQSFNGIISNSIFTSNKAQSSGGAINLPGVLQGNIDSTAFISNRAVTGSGGAVNAAVINGVFSAVTFSANTAGGDGGAVNVSSFSGSIRVSLFSDNTAGGRGGALFGLPQLTEAVTFIGNGAAQSGGAVYASSGIRSQMRNVSFSYNNAGSGGAVYGSGASLDISAAEFSRNAADVYGGALYLNAGSSVTLTNVSFTENTAGESGGAVYMAPGAGKVLNIGQTLTGIENAGRFRGNKAAGISNAVHMAGNSVIDFNMAEGSHFYVSDDITSSGAGNVINLKGLGTLHVNSGGAPDKPAQSVTVSVNTFNADAGSNLSLMAFADGSSDRIIASEGGVLNGKLNVIAGAGIYGEKVYYLISSPQPLSGELADDVIKENPVLASLYSGSANTEKLTYKFGRTANGIMLTLTGQISSKLDNNLVHMSYNQRQIAKNLDLVSAKINTGIFHDMINNIMFKAVSEQLPAFAELSPYFSANLKMNSVIDNYRPDLYAKMESRGEEETSYSGLGSNGGVWLQASGGLTKFGADENSPHDFKADSYGALFGIDGYFSGKNVILGLYGKYGKTDAYRQDASGTVESYNFGVYGGLTGRKADLRGSVSVGANKYESSRKVTFLNETEKADFTGYAADFDIEGGINFDLFERALKLRPYAGISLGALNYGKYSESGGTAALNVSGGSYLRTVPRIGLETGKEYKRFKWHAGVSGQFLATGEYLETEAYFKEGTGDRFKSRSVTRDRLFYGANAGCGVDLGKNWSAYTDWSYDMDKDFKNLKGNAGVRYFFR
ncbi:MAG: autotransporter domain-containing protein [Endomicrobium sp.]|jgi:outer membrane autotransporter protein|nr:autotransporter domain-containing protein [Endomicrobium sp.]